MISRNLPIAYQRRYWPTYGKHKHTQHAHLDAHTAYTGARWRRIPTVYVDWHCRGRYFFRWPQLPTGVDGYLARKLNQSTPFGAFLDPVADKLMVAVALVLLLEQYPYPWFTVPVAIIIGREIVISALREWMAEIGKRTSVAVSIIGKFKTTMQMIAIIVLLTQTSVVDQRIEAIGFIALYVAAILTIWSMTVYMKAAWRDLSDSM